MLSAHVAESHSHATEAVSQPFLGITHVERADTLPRPLYINTVEIDLSAPGIDFRLTPRGPSPQPSYGGIPDETITQTTRQFLNQQGAQVAINASFFAAIHSGGWTNNLGLAASNGDTYSPWESFFFSGDTTFTSALNITSDNQASMVTAPALRPIGFETNPPDVALYNTVTGSHRILTGGANTAPAPGADPLTQLQPRTAVGVTADSKLLLMTVDGRQSGFSEGVTLVELANLMAGYGAVDAINLDGGGSSTMAFNYYGDTDSSGAPWSGRQINAPVGIGNAVASERAVGANLAVFAAQNPNFSYPPAPPPVPAGVTALESFESNEGRFIGDPTDSGSTFGVSQNSQIDRVANESFYGLSSQRLVIQSSDPTTPGLGLRHLSGGGSPGNNVSLASTGYIGFLLKVHPTGVQTGDLQASIILDDGASHERAEMLDVIADGDWHLYQWNLDDPDDWFSFASGNGQIDASTFTVDSIYLTSALNLDFTVFFDLLVHDPSGNLAFLAPEPGDVNLDGVVDIFDVNVVSAHWGEAGPAGDANGDGHVDIFDVNLISANWTAASEGAASSVPEPPALPLAACGLFLAACGVWRLSKGRQRHVSHVSQARNCLEQGVSS